MEISPFNQNIDKVFGTTVYDIDFYQRDYKWEREPVERLLNDVFYAFDVKYAERTDMSPSADVVASEYPWYYLNTYVTNEVGGRVFIVDGQQRLTTLTLILIELKRRAELAGSKLKGWVQNKIAGQAGFETTFWMNHERHAATLQALYDNADVIPANSGVTARNMRENAGFIRSYLDSRLADKHRLETFIFYFLTRLVLINLVVDQTDVPMVFEVINDRGVRLRPYEILKGKLLGQIKKIELENGGYNDKWEEGVARINRHGADEIDEFFVDWLKAKFADTRAQGRRFDRDYHREMFKRDVNDKLGLERSGGKVKEFLDGDYRYYTRLYERLLSLADAEAPGYSHVFYNHLNEMDFQQLLVLSACMLDDPHEDDKIKLVSFHVDRLFSLLQLQRAYDSNEFASAVYEISAAIRGRALDEIGPVFEAKLLALLAKQRGTEATVAFDYGHFRQTSLTDLGSRFTRYLFARVDRYIATGTNSGERHLFSDLVKRKNVHGFHIEHILSRNAENLALFGGDKELFDAERNRLGGVLLLKGLDNISSGNESYAKKLKSYAQTLHWNESLRNDSYKSKLDFAGFIKRHDLAFRPLEQFGPAELEERQQLLFDVARLIWNELPRGTG